MTKRKPNVSDERVAEIERRFDEGEAAKAAKAVPEDNADAGVVDEKRPRPNIKFAGRPTWDAGKRKKLSDPAPIDRFSDAGRLVLLPPADWQKANRLFYHSDAATIARAFPHLYKLVKPK